MSFRISNDARFGLTWGDPGRYPFGDMKRTGFLRGNAQVNHPWRTGLLIVLAGVLLAGCSDSDVKAEPGVTGSPTASIPSPTSTIDPEALPAVQAYEAFTDAGRAAARHPFGKDDKIPSDADFTKYSYDPVRAQYETYIWNLDLQGAEYRGTMPTPHVTVKSTDLKAKPWPTVTLSDCQTGDSDWRLYNVKTGKPQPRATQSVSPPYRSTVTVIFFEKRWGVQKIELDSSRTCTA